MTDEEKKALWYDERYKKTIIKKAEDVLFALNYYANRCDLLEKQNKNLEEMYENRVNEYLKNNKEV